MEKINRCLVAAMLVVALGLVLSCTINILDHNYQQMVIKSLSGIFIAMSAGVISVL